MMKPLLPLLAALLAGCAVSRQPVTFRWPTELATGGVGYELPPRYTTNDGCNTCGCSRIDESEAICSCTLLSCRTIQGGRP